MKPTRARSNSYRKLLEEKTESSIAKSNEMGRTVIPIGQVDSAIRLPQIENTVHYSVLKTDKLSGDLNISINSTNGFFKGLLLNNNGGVLTVEDIDFPYRAFKMNSGSPDGSGLDFLSNGLDWFFWGFLADGDISESIADPTLPLEEEEEEEPLTGWKLQIMFYLCSEYGICCGDECKDLTDDQIQELIERIENGEDPNIDSDDDGVENIIEEIMGINPNNADSDGDGVSDGEEIKNDTDPNNADSDGDGVSDGEEIADDTDPNNADSDGDGLSDGDEKKYGGDPNNPDTDGDGISDGEEVNDGTDPNNADTDGDGIPDNLDDDTIPQPVVPGEENLFPDMPIENGIYSSAGGTFDADVILQQNRYHFSWWFKNDQPDNKVPMNLFRGYANNVSNPNWSVSVSENSLNFGGRLGDLSFSSGEVDLLDGAWHHLAFTAEREYDGGQQYRTWVSIDGVYSHIKYTGVNSGQGLVYGTDFTEPNTFLVGEDERYMSMTQIEIFEDFNPSPNQVLGAYNNGLFGELIIDQFGKVSDERVGYSVIYENIEETEALIGDYQTLVDSGIIDANGIANLNGSQGYNSLNGFIFDLYHYEPSKVEGRTISAWFKLDDVNQVTASEKTIVSKRGWAGGNTPDAARNSGWRISLIEHEGEDKIVFGVENAWRWEGPRYYGSVKVDYYSVPGSSLVADTWYNVCVTYDLGVANVYLNGSPLVSTFASNPAYESISLKNFHTVTNNFSEIGDNTFGWNKVPFQIGKRLLPSFSLTSGDFFPPGQIDKVGVYYGVMTPEEVLALYDSQNTNP